MAEDTKSPKKAPVAKPAGFDRGSQDFFRGSRGFNNFNAKGSSRSFIGMRRGSK